MEAAGAGDPRSLPGSLCLYEKNEKVLFSGDTVFPDGNIGRTDMYGGDTLELVRSIERLTGLDVATMYPGHMDVTIKMSTARFK